MSDKSRPVNLRDHEVHRLLEHGRVLLVRLVKPQPLPPVAHYERDGDKWIARGATVDVERQFSTTWPSPIRCPFGLPGQALYGRETYYYDMILDGRAAGCLPETEAELDRDSLYYRADGTCCEQIPECCCAEYDGGTPWRSPITMPRWAVRPKFQRLVLRSADVRRLQDVPDEDDFPGAGSTFRGGYDPWVWLVEIEVGNND